MRVDKRKRRLKRKIIFYITRTAMVVAGVLVISGTIMTTKKLIVDAGDKNDDKNIYKNVKTLSEKIAKEDVKKYMSKPSDKPEPDWSTIPDTLKKLYDNNKDARQFVIDYNRNKDKKYDIDLSEYENYDKVPLLMQWDERWGYKNYSGNLFGLSGCGPTALSMAAIYITGDSKYTPQWMMDYSTKNGYSVEGSGSSWMLMSDGARGIGLSSKELPLDESVMKNALRDKCVIIAIMGPGDFTDSGHFIVITGYNEDSKTFTINDSNSYSNSRKRWNFDKISGQIKDMWKIS